MAAAAVMAPTDMLASVSGFLAGTAPQIPVTGVTVVMAVMAAAAVVAVGLVLSVPSWRGDTSKSKPVREATILAQTLELELGVAPSDDLAEQAVQAAEPTLNRNIFRPSKPRSEGSRPPGAESAPADSLEEERGMTVSAIFVDGDSRQAMISGRRVANGDSIGGYWVIDISRDSILLWNEDGFHTVRWREDR